MNGIAVDDSLVEDGAADDDDDEDAGMDVDDDAAEALADEEEFGGMDVDGGDNADGGNDDDDDLPTFFKEKPYVPPPKTPSKRKRTKVDELVRTKVLRVLEQLEMADRRSRQCDETDFLKLLDAVRPYPFASQQSPHVSVYFAAPPSSEHVLTHITNIDEQRGYPLLVSHHWLRVTTVLKSIIFFGFFW